jgi:hypothetical protein
MRLIKRALEIVKIVVMGILFGPGLQLHDRRR